MFKISTLAILLAFPISCKAKRNAQLKDISDRDKQSIVDRLDNSEAGKELLSPGPRFAEVEGDERYTHKLRVNALLESPAWNELQVFKKQSDVSASIQEYNLKVLFKDEASTEFPLNWTIPAISIFGAPTPVRNLIVQSAVGFWNFAKQEAIIADASNSAETSKTLKSFQYSSPVRMVEMNHRSYGDISFLSVDLYHNLSKNFADSSGGNKSTEIPAGFSAEAPYGLSNAPFYFVKNAVGSNALSLDLTYGSLFLEIHGSRAAGSGFGIWLGDSIPRKILEKYNTQILVVAKLASNDDVKRLRKFEASFGGQKRAVVIKSEVAAGRLMPAYDSKGLIVGSFDQDIGAVVPEKLKGFEKQATLRPERQEGVSPLAETDVKANSKTTPTVSHPKRWTFEQFANGRKWQFFVFYQTPKNGSDNDFEIMRISGLRDGAFEVTANEFDRQKSGTMTTATKTAYWWNMKFTRESSAPYLCNISYQAFGTPLIGWDENVVKDANCEIEH